MSVVDHGGDKCGVGFAFGEYAIEMVDGAATARRDDWYGDAAADHVR